MNDSAGMLVVSLVAIGLGVCVLIRATGMFNLSGPAFLFGLAATASLVALVLGGFRLLFGSPDREVSGAILFAGGTVGLALCVGQIGNRDRV